MSYTIDEYNALKAIAGTGILTVNYGDKQVTYRSTKDIYDILAKMEIELFPAQHVKRKIAVSDKGIYPSYPDWKNEHIR